jgi:hypothetical protein
MLPMMNFSISRCYTSYMRVPSVPVVHTRWRVRGRYGCCRAFRTLFTLLALSSNLPTVSCLYLEMLSRADHTANPGTNGTPLEYGQQDVADGLRRTIACLSRTLGDPPRHQLASPLDPMQIYSEVGIPNIRTATSQYELEALVKLILGDAVSYEVFF